MFKCFKSKRVVFLLRLVIVCCPLSSSFTSARNLKGSFYEKHFDYRDGLISANCNNLYKDPKGFLWIVMRSGVSRSYVSQPRCYGLLEGQSPDVFAYCIPDRAGHMYVEGSTSVYLRGMGKVKPFLKVLVFDTLITMFLPVGSNNFDILYKNIPGLFCFAGGRFKAVPGINFPITNVISSSDYRQIYFRTVDGVVQIFKDNTLSRTIASLSGPFTGSAEDRIGNIWIAGQHKLYKTSSAGFSDSLEFPPLASGGQFSVYFTGERSAWLMTRWKLYYTNGLTLSKADYEPPPAYYHVSPRGLIADQDQNIWPPIPMGYTSFVKLFHLAFPGPAWYYSSGLLRRFFWYL